MREIPLKVKRRRSVIPQAYELNVVMTLRVVGTLLKPSSLVFCCVLTSKTYQNDRLRSLKTL